MPSNFIWYELLTTDVEGAARFYGSVVGWTLRDSGQAGMDYRFWLANETPIGGLMAMPPSQEAPGMQPGWLGYVQVPDTDAAVTQITSAGGAVAMPAMSIPDVGRMAMVTDPQGAPFHVMTPQGAMPSPPIASCGPGEFGPAGHAGWHELHTSDWQAALRFYGGVFGWAAGEGMDMGPMGTYQLFHAGGEAIGGMMNSPDMPRPTWLYYFNVDDITAAQARVEAAGGTVLMGPQQVPGDAWIIQGRDPQGAMFALLGRKG